MYFLVGRVLGKRRQGLFGPPVGGEDVLEFGYCFDVRGANASDLNLCLANSLTGLDQSISTSMGIPIRFAIPLNASHCTRLLGVELLRYG